MKTFSPHIMRRNSEKSLPREPPRPSPQVPLDLGSFRKQKLSHEGKATAFICDVVFHPLLIQLFMDDEFNSKQSNNDPRLTFRPYLGNVAFNMIERELKIKLSRAEKDIKLVKECRYKEGLLRVRGTRVCVPSEEGAPLEVRSPEEGQCGVSFP